MKRQTIRNEGAKGEAELRRLVPACKRSPAEKLGDAVLSVDGTDWYIEVKQCVKGNTINQVRAIKFTALVVYSPQLPKPWAVLAPQEVVRMTAFKERGQHNEIALECANFSLNALPPKSRCSDDELGARLVSALRSAVPYVVLRSTLGELQVDLGKLKRETQEKVAAALAAGDESAADG